MLCITVISCSKQVDDPTQKIVNGYIGVSIKSGETMEYHLIGLGHVQDISITRAPQHSALSEIVKRTDDLGHVYKYSSVAGYIGLDTVIIESLNPDDKNYYISEFTITVQ